MQLDIVLGGRLPTMNAPSVDRIKIAPDFWTSLGGIGGEPIAVARQARLPLTVITEPFVTTAQYYSIWQAYSELVGNIAKGTLNLRPRTRPLSIRRLLWRPFTPATTGMR